MEKTTNNNEHIENEFIVQSWSPLSEIISHVQRVVKHILSNYVISFK